jgi:hypothetical protein
VALHRDADRVAAALLAQACGDLLVLKPRVGAQQDLPGRAGAPHAREQLVDEAQRAALGVGLALAQADVQDLARAGAGRQQRVIAKPAGVAVAGALLGVTVDLADEAVDVDHEAALARPRARPPRAEQRLAEDPVELADMPERKRAQERAERRRRHRPVPEDRLGPPGAQHVAVIDAIGAQQHRVHQREHLSSRPRRSRPTAEPDGGVDERLEPQPPPERDREHEPRVDGPTRTDSRPKNGGLRLSSPRATQPRTAGVSHPALGTRPRGGAADSHPRRGGTPAEPGPASPVRHPKVRDRCDLLRTRAERRPCEQG